MMTKKTARVKGDTFILCTFPFSYGGQALVLESGNSPGEIFANIGDHLDTERLSFCRVGYWVAPDSYDPSDVQPREVTTIFEIMPFETDALEDEDDDDVS